MYNGYENYETWNVVLWISNEEYIYYYIRNLAQKEKFTAKTAKKVTKEIYPNGTPDFKKGRYALVNWQHVADAFNELGA